MQTKSIKSPDVEQSRIRVLINALALAHIIGYEQFTGISFGEEFWTFVCLITGYTLIVAIAAHLKPAASEPRRFITLAVDGLIVSCFLYFTGQLGAAFVAIYLWVSLGYGIRYGQRFLIASTVWNALGFLVVIVASPYWADQQLLGMGLLVAFVLIPLHVATLQNRLRDAVKRADSANEAKSTFVANISHEMRTPLNGVIGTSDLLWSTELNPAQKRHVSIINTSAQALLALIENVLDFSRIESGKLQRRPCDFDLQRLLTETIDMLQVQAQAKHIGLTLNIGDEVPTQLNGDRDHLRQILINLIGNAVKFTQQGGVMVTVASATVSSCDFQIRFIIQDTGVGMSPEFQSRIFERFSQADESDTRQFGGTGLGTTISRQLVELMQGDIALHSIQGEGSTFTVSLPFTAGNSPEPAVVVPVFEQADTQPLQILIAEDNIINQTVMVSMLEGRGHRVTVADNGKIALEKLHSGIFDLAIVDLQMPVMGGLEAMQQYRAQHPDATLPFIVLTASATADTLAQCTRAGADAYLTKPVTAATLFPEIDRVVNNPSSQA